MILTPWLLLLSLSRPVGSHCTTDDPAYRFERWGYPICRRDVSTGEKDRVYRSYDIPQSERHRYEIDHFYALSLGGSNRTDNLWPIPRENHGGKGKLEQSLRQRLDAHQIELPEAWEAIDAWFDDLDKGVDQRSR